MTKATAETIREAAVRSLCGSPFCTYPKCACSTAPSEVDDILATLPITLEQLAKYANGELVLADPMSVAAKGDLVIPAALRGDPDKVSKAHADWIPASPEKVKP